MVKFNTYQAGNKTIVTTRYAGKAIKGVAKCNPVDNYEQAVGAELAKQRCEVKLAKARLQKNEAEQAAALEALQKAEKKYAKAEQSVIKARRMLADMEGSLAGLEEQLK